MLDSQEDALFLNVNEEIEKLEKKFKNRLIINTSKIFNIAKSQKVDFIVNYEKVNNIIKINKFHEMVNEKLPINGIYISCAESIVQRSKRKWKKNLLLLAPIFSFWDFLFKRVMPKLPIMKKIYFTLTQGKNRVMTETEIVGRLVSCGFEVNNILYYNNLTYVFSKKIRAPHFDMDPSYGPIFKMKRVGYDNKIISVYKFRTMSPYSEYVQSEIINKNKLSKSGKINNDYRVTFYGKFLRKYWIDEFPMIINWFKRDLKLVGVRPLSEDYFKRYPKDLQKLRVKTKPGLIPPYYVDLPVTFDEICDSERRYLDLYLKNPFKTDFRYFFKALYNILIKRRRSG
tara:strand:- start:12894 stop:13919 length:1026 start_codon:yes stop_codon:yes gene_type:complete